MPTLTKEEVEKLLSDIGVPGVSISIINRDGSIEDVAAGLARISTKEKMRPNNIWKSSHRKRSRRCCI